MFEGNGSTPYYHAGRGSHTFAFIDAENTRLGLEGFLRRRRVEEKYIDLFAVKNLFTLAHEVDRFFVYSAIPRNEVLPDWISDVKASSNFIFRQTRLTKKNNRKKQEGVDVLLAIEAMQHAFKRTMECCVIFSDDGDLMPLVDALVGEGIQTHVVGFGNPEKSEVASRLRDGSDHHYSIGEAILRAAFHNSFCKNRSNIWQKHKIEEMGSIGHPICLGEVTFDTVIPEHDLETVILSETMQYSDEGFRWQEFQSRDHAVAWVSLFGRL